MSLPLDGIRVVDVSEHGFVPSCAALLAEYGADVIKVERLDGDACRDVIGSGMVPTEDGVDYLFEIFNRNKRGIGLDIRTDAGYAVLTKLVQSADVFVTNQLPQVQRKLRTTAEDIRGINAKIVYARGHGQGQTGPDAEVGGFDSVSYWTRGGVAHLLTPPGVTTALAQRPATGDVPSGTFLASGICAALVRAARTGEGGIVDTSLLGAALWTMGPDLTYTSFTGKQMDLTHVKSPLASTYRTQDGYFLMLMMINEARYWESATDAFGLQDLAAKYADPAERKAAWGELLQPFQDVIGSLNRDELRERLSSRNCIFSFFATPFEVLQDRAALANGYFMEHPDVPGMKIVQGPVQFDNTAPTIRRAAPRLGEHTKEILNELGYSAADVTALLTGGDAVATD
jgi:crotonobetainyl-CoA:carnitine CoA-transferase CaiB-like acyl-CoA transferase